MLAIFVFTQIPFIKKIDRLKDWEVKYAKSKNDEKVC